MPAAVRALGVDLGARRIGVAVSDTAGRLATPYEVVQRGADHDIDHARLLGLATEVEAEAVVVGLPLSLDGSIGPAARGVLDEVDELAARTALPVVTYDERLTTVSADRSLREQSLSAPERRQVVDKVAASVLLQAWLDAGCPLEAEGG
jgi:putative Holliday junction resolvase